MRASAQSTSSPFIQIFSVSRTDDSSQVKW
jgi:hypothetical protein